MKINWAKITTTSFQLAIAFAVVWGFSTYKSRKLPDFVAVSTELQKEPIQTPTTQKPFEKYVQDQSYQIQPVAEYEMWGLVVTDHDPSSWKGQVHAIWKDFLNTKDICVIWGKNAVNPLLKEFNFSHGEWTCYVQTNSSPAWQSFQKDQLANNHLIPSTPEVAKLIRNSEVGDEIHFKGHLVNYQINGGASRNTSLDRKDIENGACEIVHVQSFATIARHNQTWIWLRKTSKALCLVSLLGIALSMAVVILKRHDSDRY